MPDLTDEEVKAQLDAKAVSVPPLWVVETRNGYGQVPGADDVKYACVVTALDTANGVVVHLPLLFDWDFAVTVGLIDQAKSDSLQAQAAANPINEPGGSEA